MTTEAKRAASARHNSKLKPISIRLNPNDPADARRLLVWQSLENKTESVRQWLDKEEKENVGT